MKRLMMKAASIVVIVGLMTGCGKKVETITVVSREEGSGTRGAFTELLGIQEKDEKGETIDRTTEEAIISNSTSIVMTSIQNDESAIGYISLGALDGSVKAATIDGAVATVEHIKDGSYQIARPFNIATTEGVSEVAKDFIDFILSSQGQQIVEEEGYISVDPGKSFSGKKVAGKIVIAGSSSVTPVMEKLKEAYEALNTEVTIELQESDSTTGMNAAKDGICDIGMASRELKSSEIEAGLKGQVIAMDGIAIIINKANPIEALSSEEVRGIFTGEITDWEALK